MSASPRLIFWAISTDGPDSHPENVYQQPVEVSWSSQNFDADSNVLLYAAEDLIFHPKGLDEILKGAKFIGGANEVVEEDDVAGFEAMGQCRKNK